MHFAPTQYISVAGILLLASSPSWACEAHNDVGDTCEITCDTGQSAVCENESGAIRPTCVCEDEGIDGLTLRVSPQVLSYKDVGEDTSAKVLSVNVLSVINRKLESVGDHHLGQSCARVEVGRDCPPSPPPCITDAAAPTSSLLYPQACIGVHIGCSPSYAQRCVPVVGKLVVGGPLSVVKGPYVVVDPPNWNDIPVEEYQYMEEYNNCSAVAQSMTYTHTEKMSFGLKISKSQTLNIGRELSVNVNVDYKPPVAGGIGASAGLGLKFSNSISTTNSEGQDYQTEETETFQAPIAVPAGIKVTYSHTFTKRIVSVDYNGTVELDAPIGQNDDGIRLVSDILPQAVDRTFSFAGKIEDATLLGGHTDLKTTKAEKCDATHAFKVTTGFTSK